MKKSLLVLALLTGGMLSCFAVEGERSSGSEVINMNESKIDGNGAPITEEQKVEEVKKGVAAQQWENAKEFGLDAKEFTKKHPVGTTLTLSTVFLTPVLGAMWIMVKFAPKINL